MSTNTSQLLSPAKSVPNDYNKYIPLKPRWNYKGMYWLDQQFPGQYSNRSPNEDRQRTKVKMGCHDSSDGSVSRIIHQIIFKGINSQKDSLPERLLLLFTLSLVFHFNCTARWIPIYSSGCTSRWQ